MALRSFQEAFEGYVAREREAFTSVSDPIIDWSRKFLQTSKKYIESFGERELNEYKSIIGDFKQNFAIYFAIWGGYKPVTLAEISKDDLRGLIFPDHSIHTFKEVREPALQRLAVNSVFYDVLKGAPTTKEVRAYSDVPELNSWSDVPGDIPLALLCRMKNDSNITDMSSDKIGDRVAFLKKGDDLFVMTHEHFKLL